jgi:hypothetical protein
MLLQLFCEKTEANSIQVKSRDDGHSLAPAPFHLVVLKASWQSRSAGPFPVVSVSRKMNITFIKEI